jgi:GNAT superfamily N-acetyltransferase
VVVLSSGYSIRPAAIADLDTLTAHRRAMFFEMGYDDGAGLEAMTSAFRPWLLARLQSGEYLAWVAVTEDEAIVAGAGLWLMDWPPHMIGPGSRRGNILNVYTEAAHRRRGLARRLMLTALEWSRAHGIRAVILHASDEGRGLYEELGFRASNEMRLLLEG